MSHRAALRCWGLHSRTPKAVTWNRDQPAHPPPPGLHGMVCYKIRACLTLCPINSTEILATRIEWCQVDEETMQWPNLSFLSSYYLEDMQWQISFLTVGFENVYLNESMGVRCPGGGRERSYFSSRENDGLLQWKFLHGTSQGRSEERKGSLFMSGGGAWKGVVYRICPKSILWTCPNDIKQINAVSYWADWSELNSFKCQLF